MKVNSQTIGPVYQLEPCRPYWKWVVLVTGEDSGDWYPYNSEKEARKKAIEFAQEHPWEDFSVYLVGNGKVWKALEQEGHVRIKGVRNARTP